VTAGLGEPYEEPALYNSRDHLAAPRINLGISLGALQTAHEPHHTASRIGGTLIAAMAISRPNKQTQILMARSRYASNVRISFTEDF